MLNPDLFHRLETYGLTDQHLEQLIAVCQRGTGKATWHVDREGLCKVEVTVFAVRRDYVGMRTLTHFLQKDQ